MAIKKSDLYSSLWASRDGPRGAGWTGLRNDSPGALCSLPSGMSNRCRD